MRSQRRFVSTGPHHNRERRAGPRSSHNTQGERGGLLDVLARRSGASQSWLAVDRARGRRRAWTRAGCSRRFRKGGWLVYETTPDETRMAGMSADAIADVVSIYARALGWSLAPHDLRRTFAKLARAGQAPLEQIQLALGHQSIQTTQRYLGSELDLVDAACDRLGIRL
jgi:hypothetical protein